jgi:hypothetical protein
MSKKVITRREFLKGSTTAAIAGAVYMNMPGTLLSKPSEKTPVVLIRRKDVLVTGNKISPQIVQQMLDEAVTTLVKEKDLVNAWKKIVRANDIVGIKTNVWSYLPTPKELENAIKKRVMDVGVKENSIGMDDRGIRNNPIFKKATALINVRPMRTHHWSGVGTLLKNYIMFVDRPYEYHGDTCADLATIWKLPQVKDRTRLNILVMFTPLFHSVGPHDFNPKYLWNYSGLIVGFDPVAVDATGVRIIMNKRKEFFKDDRPLNPPAKHIFLADTRHHLGTADPAKINLIKLGWDQDILI